MEVVLCLQADVVCYELGFNGGAATYFWYSYFAPISSNFSLDYVSCNGDENSILDCQHSENTTCNSYEGAGVQCVINSSPGWKRHSHTGIS